MLIFKLLLLVVFAIPHLFVFGLGMWDQFIFFSIGLFSGWLLLLLDEKWLFRFYLEQNDSQVNLITRSILFILVLIPVTLLIVTSTGSLLGIGLVQGLWICLLTEMWQLRLTPRVFNQKFLEGLKEPLEANLVNALVFGLTAFFIIASAWIYL